MTNEERFIELESKIAYHEHQLEQQNQALYDQHKQLERLERICQRLADQVKGLTHALPMTKPEDEKPPHY